MCDIKEEEDIIKYFNYIFEESSFLKLYNDDEKNIYYEVIGRKLISRNKIVKVWFNKEKLISTYRKMNKLKKIDGNKYYKEDYFECLIEGDIASYKLGKYGDMNTQNSEIDISLSEVSDEVSLNMLIDGLKMFKDDSICIKPTFVNNTVRLITNGMIMSDEDGIIDGFDFIKDRDVLSIKIKSVKSLDVERFIDYQTSHLFNIALVMNRNFVESRKNIHSYWGKRTHIVFYKKKLNSLDVPKKIFIKDILKYYTNAQVLDNLPSKYLSYYHILEYFFEDVHYEKMIEDVRGCLSDPSFSLRDDQTIKEFVKTFEKKISYKKGDGYVFNEKNALKLTIERYMNMKEIEEKLNKKDKHIVKYYKNYGCEFANAKKIDFINLQTIVNRIYKIRNSLVHSKNTDIGRYRPFKDEEKLEKELELIKTISEILIVKSGRLI